MNTLLVACYSTRECAPDDRPVSCGSGQENMRCAVVRVARILL